MWFKGVGEDFLMLNTGPTPKTIKRSAEPKEWPHRSSTIGRSGFVVPIGRRCCSRWSLPHDWWGDSSSIWSCSWSCLVWKHQFLIGDFGTELLYKPMFGRLERWRDRSERWTDRMKWRQMCRKSAELASGDTRGIWRWLGPAFKDSVVPTRKQGCYCHR